MTKNAVMREVIDWTWHIAIAVLVGILVITFVGQRTIVYGNSMQPTLHTNDQLIVEKLTPRFGHLKYRDIVTIYYPEQMEDGRQMLIKRVIATEGQTLEIKDGAVFVNGKQLKEDYINGTSTMAISPEYADLVVPKGYIYVMGDNREPGESKDSRMIGPIELSRVKGKVIVRFYPFDRMGAVK